MKKIIAIIIALLFILNAVIILTNTTNNSNNSNSNNSNIYTPTTTLPYNFSLYFTLYITGLQLKNNYLSIEEFVYQNGVQTNNVFAFYSTNSTFVNLYDSDTGLGLVIAQGYAFNIYAEYLLGSASNAIMTFKLIINVYPNSVILFNANTNGLPSVNPNIYITPQAQYYNTTCFSGETVFLSKSINYYNDINKIPAEPIGKIYFTSNQTYTLIIDNETYVNIKNFTIALPLGTYNYIAYNKTNFYSNGTATVIQTNILQYPIQFSSINFAINYVFIIFILIITIISLVISYLLARNYYAFFTAEIFFLFIGYSAGIPYISITIFALALFFLVFIIVYKVILE